VKPPPESRRGDRGLHSPKAGGGWRILLAEDDDDHALLIEMALERAADARVEVLRARDGDEAVARAREEDPDLILLDLKMPGRGGHEVLEALKGDEVLKVIPVAVLTSSDRDEDMARSYGLGGNHFLTKPENPMELEARLRALLRNVEEMAAIRRGSSGVVVSGRSAGGPGTLALSRWGPWLAFVVVVLGLVVFARIQGVL
jgi:DNA-binding response OmpR family regulator